MGIFDYHYLSEGQVKGFDNYKYSCIDNSPIAVYISHPFWNWLVKFYPEWLAPNTLTLGGFSLVLGSLFLVSAFDYDMNANSSGGQHIPNWIWLVCAICTLLGHTMDGTDGKQARRTGASGPTGELFDHGLDSWATVPFTITLFSIFGRSDFSISALRLLCILISVQLVFIVTHWEKYNTGVLFLSWGYDASQYGLTFFYLATYALGFETWKFNVFGNLAFAEVFELGFYACCFGSLVMSLVNIHKAYVIEKTGRQSSLYEGILPMVPATLLFATSIVWGAMSPTKVIDRDPHMFLWTMGVVFSNIACRLIIAQMSHTRTETINALLVAYMAVTGLAVMGVLGSAELNVLRLLAVVVTVAHVHYGICVGYKLLGGT
uniref:Ethanolaminephosphotransferase 1 n=1 Tax=Plectus sambesii TaxID=2011161 RepID=A0A914X1B3_9BILA